MNKKTKLLIILLLIIIASVFYIFSFKKQNVEEKTTKYQFFSTQLDSINSESIRLENIEKDFIIIDFWATWCPPCIAEIPHFISLTKKYPNVLILGVSLDQSIENVKTFINENKVNYPIVFADNAMNKIIEKDFGQIKSIPTTYIFDSNKKLIKKAVGYKDLSFFEEIINKL